jgi:L-asparaginase
MMPGPDRPCVAVFTLGGTIAMTPAPDGGVSPALSASDLLAAVPGLSNAGTDLRVTDFRRVPGASLTFADLFELADAINKAIGDGCAGAVVTQGTDTIEEVSYVLDLLLSAEAAIMVAASPTARGQGCLVAFNDQIHAARWVRKTHSSSPAAFASPGYGPIGDVIEGRAHIPVTLRRRSPSIKPDPHRSVRVGVTMIALGDDGTLIESIAEQSDGLVVAAFGVGHVPADVAPVLGKLAERIPVVLASRTGAGPVHEGTYGFPGSERDLLARGLVSAGYLDPLKARILLHLLISSGADDARIRETFAVAGELSESDV